MMSKSRLYKRSKVKFGLSLAIPPDLNIQKWILHIISGCNGHFKIDCHAPPKGESAKFVCTGMMPIIHEYQVSCF